MRSYLVRARQGAIASLLLLAAGISLLLMMRTDSIEFAPQRNLYLTAAIILLLGSVGPLAEVLDMPGQILTWNGLGWCLGLAIFGWQGVGSLPLWPLILGVIAFTFWPREDGSTIPASAIAIAFLGGFGICWLAWGDVTFTIPEKWKAWL